MIWLDYCHWFSNPPYWLFAPSSPKFCISYCFQILMEICSRPRNNGLCKIWWANRVYYRVFENRELSLLLFLWSLSCRSILARNWSTGTVRVPQTSQRKIKRIWKNCIFDLKRSFDWHVRYESCRSSTNFWLFFDFINLFPDSKRWKRFWGRGYQDPAEEKCGKGDDGSGQKLK